MFSGKTEELIRRLRREKFVTNSIAVFIPMKDDRRGIGKIISSGGQNIGDLGIQPIPVATPQDILAHTSINRDIVAIDEAQFFDHTLTAVVDSLLERSPRYIIVSGLELDANGHPFGPMPNLLAMADDIIKCVAVCVACRAPATRSHRLVPSDQIVQVGGAEAYEARCRDCWLEARSAQRSA